MAPVRFKNRTFFATQLLFFVGINVVVLGLVAFVTLNSMTSTVSGIVEHSISSLIQTTAGRIETEVRRISNDMKSVASFQAIHEYLEAPLFSKAAWEDQVTTEFRNFLAAREEIALIRFASEEGTLLSIGQNGYMERVKMELSAEVKKTIENPDSSLTILEPGSVRLTDEFGTIISQKFVYFVARVMSRTLPDAAEASGRKVVGFLVSAVVAKHFQTTLEALNLAGISAPAHYQTNSFLINSRLDPVTQLGPEAAKLADPDKRVFAEGLKSEFGRFISPLGSATFRFERLDFPAAMAFSFEEPLTKWKVLALVPEAYVMRDVKTVRNILISILCFGLLVAVFLTYYASRKIAKPIGDLVRATETVSQGNLDQAIDLDSFREFNTLGQNFNSMTQKLKATIAERIAESERKASLEQELKTASLFQKLFLPSGTYRLDGLSVVAHYQPASHMGGDWFSYGVTADGWLHVHLGDVTGHGTGSALVASFCKGVTDALYGDRQDSRATIDAVPIEGVHQCLNNLLFNHDQSMAFMTLLSLALNLETGELRYVSSGHPPQFILDHESRKMSLIKQAVGGTLLGFKAQKRRTLSGTTFLKPGQSIFLYSDGLIDVAAQAGRSFNQRRLVDFLLKRSDETPEQLKDRVRAELLTAPEPVDDVTMIIVKLHALPVRRSVASDDVDAA